MWVFRMIKADDESGECAHCEQEFESGDIVAVDTKLTGDGEPCDVIVAHPECREVSIAFTEIEYARSVVEVLAWS